MKDDGIKAMSSDKRYGAYIKAEREFIYSEICENRFTDLSQVKLIEIGAGSGDNLVFFNKLGLLWNNIYANELLEERGEELANNIDSAAIIQIGDARELKYKNEFDIVFQSTVFTSVLDPTFKKKLANKMMDMVKKNGIMLWYDFKYDNPNNKDVKGIGRREIEALFEEFSSFKYYNVTLLPPLGRRVGRLYGFINTVFPFLKTHLICVISNRKA